MKNFFKKLSMMLAAVLLLSSLSVGVVSAAAKPKLNKTKITLNVKKSYQLKLSNNKRKVKWSSSKKSVATVSSKGKITAKKKGTATITAKVGSKKYNCKVTVKQPVTSLKMNKKAYTLKKKGATVTLKASAKPSSANNKSVTWSSSNKKVATVSNKGKVKAVGNGTCTITAKAKDGSKKKATCKITVKIRTSSKPEKTQAETPQTEDLQTEIPQPSNTQVIHVNSVVIGPYTSLSFTQKGETSALTAYVVPSNATNTAVTWRSSNNSVATVNSNGLVTAVGNGNAVITLTSVDGSKTATCNVTVNIPAPQPDPEPDTDPDVKPLDPTKPVIENVSLPGVLSGSVAAEGRANSYICGLAREYPGSGENNYTGLSEEELRKVSFKIEGDINCVEITGDSYNPYSAVERQFSFRCLKAGTVKVTAFYNNSILKIWNVTFTSGWPDYLPYENWKNKVKHEICPSGNATVETLDALKNYIQTNFTYDVYSPGASNKYYAWENMKCDCFGATGMFGDIASDFGFKVGYVTYHDGKIYDYMSDAVSNATGHINNAVWINGAWVGYDAQPPVFQ